MFIGKLPGLVCHITLFIYGWGSCFASNIWNFWRKGEGWGQNKVWKRGASKAFLKWPLSCFWKHLRLWNLWGSFEKFPSPRLSYSPPQCIALEGLLVFRRASMFPRLVPSCPRLVIWSPLLWMVKQLDRQTAWGLGLVIRYWCISLFHHSTLTGSSNKSATLWKTNFFQINHYNNLKRHNLFSIEK